MKQKTILNLSLLSSTLGFIWLIYSIFFKQLSQNPLKATDVLKLLALLHYSIFWFYVAFFFLVDRFQFFSSSKIQHNKYMTKNQLIQCVSQCLINQILITTPVAFLMLYPYLNETIICSIPELKTFFMEIFECVITVEIGFYYIHRLFHSVPWLYGNVHKMHHEFKHPSAVAALYTSPVEHAVCNVFPVLLGPWLVRASFFTLCVWISLATANAALTHSGYSIWLISRDHDDHHLQLTGNYGVLGIMDYLHGTKLKCVKNI